MWPSVIILALIAAAFTAVVVCGIRNKRRGGGCGSCGGACGSCGLNCHARPAEPPVAEPPVGEGADSNGDA